MRRDPWYVRYRLAMMIVGFTTTAVLSFWVLVVGPDEILRAYPSPERHKGVREWSAASAELPRAPEGDFDGDEVKDVIDCRGYYMQPFFGEKTRVLVEIRSGASGELLLVHAWSGMSWDAPFWCGDLDGNGTDEVAVEDGDEMTVLGRNAELH
jgi:hypothetical protein